MINIYISSLKTAVNLFLVTVFICVFGIISQLYKYNLGYIGLLFDFDRGVNISSWFQSALFLISSLLFSMIAIIKKNSKSKFTIHWIVLCFIPLIVSMDKMVGLHNIFIEVSNHISQSKGVMHYLLVAFVLGIFYTILMVYLSLFDDIPKITQVLFLVTAAIYLEGAIGIELIRSRIVDFLDPTSLSYLTILSFREFLEITSVIVLIYALISYISAHIKDVQFLIEDKF